MRRLFIMFGFVSLVACGGAPAAVQPAATVASTSLPTTVPAPTAAPSATTAPATAAPNPTMSPVAAAGTTTPAPTAVGRTPAPSDQLATVEPSKVPEQVAGDAMSNKMVDKARADLVKRLSIAADAVTVKSVEAVEWNDGSLGCPQPGVMYLQVITSGYKIVLAAQGKEYAYHTDMDRQVVYCAGR